MTVPANILCRRARRGMTLVEASVAIAMFSIIALALGSALTIAAKAIPDAKSANPSLLAASAVLDRIGAELFYALSISEMTAKSVTFTVADRNSDGAPETIRYAWSGVAGGPLTRQYNADAAVTVLADVREFALNFDKRAVKQPTTFTEGPEQQLYSSGKGLLGGSYTLNNNDCIGQTFPTPNWANNVVYWRVTRIQLTARRSGDNGWFRVEVRNQDASGLPGPKVLDKGSYQENTLPSNWGPYDITFSKAASLLPSESACIVLRVYKGSDDVADLWTNNLALSLNGSKLVTSSNSGSTWSSNGLRALAMTAWGAPTTQDADAYQYFLTGVRATLRTGTDPAGRAVANFAVATQPQVNGP